MNKIFENVSVADIIKPGHIYLLCEDLDRGWPPEPIEYLYVIKEENEILQALELELCIVLAETFDPIKFVHIRKVNENCHEFTMLCYEKELKEDVRYTLYLHRIQSFEEALGQVKRMFGIDRKV